MYSSHLYSFLIASLFVFFQCISVKVKISHAFIIHLPFKSCVHKFHLIVLVNISYVYAFTFPMICSEFFSSSSKYTQIKKNEVLNFFSYLTGKICIQACILPLYRCDILSYAYLLAVNLYPILPCHHPSSKSINIQSTKWNKLSIFVLVNLTNNVTIAI